jgi:hypothetical protein
VFRYIHYTIIPEISLDKEMTLKVEFELFRSLRDAHLSINFPKEFLIYSYREEIFSCYPSWPWVPISSGAGVIPLGNLSKGKKYEYTFRIKATKAGYYHTSCSVRGSTLFLKPGMDVVCRDVEITPEGGRLVDYNPEKEEYTIDQENE